MNRTLAPTNLEGILKDTFYIYKNNFLRLTAIASIVVVPIAIVSLIINLLLPTYGKEATGVLSNALISLPVALVAFVAYILMFGAIVHAMAEQYFNQPVSIGRAYSFAWRRMGDMFGAVVLYGLAIGGIFLAAILISVIIAAAIGGTYSWLIGFAIAFILILFATPPALYLGIIWNFMVQTAMLEGCGPRAALSHSAAVVKGSWWRVLGIVLLLLLIVQAIFMIFNIPAMMGAVSWIMTGVMSGTMTETPPQLPTWVMIWSTVGGAIGYIISFPIYTIGETLLYFDLRVRKQGYNLDALANELGLRSTDTIA
jgi:MFS family permease